jgi:hypothetical protein
VKSNKNIILWKNMLLNPTPGGSGQYAAASAANSNQQ